MQASEVLPEEQRSAGQTVACFRKVGGQSETRNVTATASPQMPEQLFVTKPAMLAIPKDCKVLWV